MEITLSEQALNDFKELSKIDQPKVFKKIQFLQTTGINFNTYKLQNSDFYRIRQGDYRIIFSLNNLENKILILAISQRKDAY